MKKFIKSLFTDSEWDGDASKVIGWILVVVGIIGVFTNKSDARWLIVTGALTITSGKFAGNE